MKFNIRKASDRTDKVETKDFNTLEELLMFIKSDAVPEHFCDGAGEIILAIDKNSDIQNITPSILIYDSYIE